MSNTTTKATKKRGRHADYGRRQRERAPREKENMANRKACGDGGRGEGRRKCCASPARKERLAWRGMGRKARAEFRRHGGWLGGWAKMRAALPFAKLYFCA